MTAMYPYIPIPIDGVEISWDKGEITANKWTGSTVVNYPYTRPRLSIALDYKTLLDDALIDESLRNIEGFYLSQESNWGFLFSPFYLTQLDGRALCLSNRPFTLDNNVPSGVTAYRLHQVENQVIGTGDGVTTDYQVIRTWGPYQETIEYLDPTIISGVGKQGFGDDGHDGCEGVYTGLEPPYVYVDGVFRQDYDVDGAVIKFWTPPGAGQIITISYNFFYKMRFAQKVKSTWITWGIRKIDKVHLIQD